MGFTEMLLFRRGWTWKIFWHTAMADCAIDWKVIIFANRCVYREKVLAEKWCSFVREVRLVTVHVENEGCFQALPPDA